MDALPSPSSDSNFGHPIVTRRTIVQATTDMAGPSSSEAVSQDAEQTGTSSAPARSTSPTTEKTHGHSHAAGSMNMRAIVLHVLGDALGNVGVIGAGLVMWLSRWPGRFYLDPAVSLALSALICVSALPLVRGAAAVLLQAAPPGLVLADVRARIARAPGVRGVHELHVWQLSERALVASVHVRVARGRDFMATAAEIRARLHVLGIHSCTIQPEYDDEAAPEKCLIACPPEAACEPTDACCRAFCQTTPCVFGADPSCSSSSLRGIDMVDNS
jgi:zinc transporter 1